MSEFSTAGARAAKLTAVLLAASGLVFLAALTLSPNGATRVFAWPWWLFWRFALAVPAILLLLRLFSPGERHVTPGAITLLTLGLAGLHVAAAAASPHPQESLSFAGAIAAPACLAALLAAKPRAWPVVPRVLAWAGVVCAVWSLAYWAGHGALSAIANVRALNAMAGEPMFDLGPHGFRNPHMLGHFNYTAGLGLLTLPWIVAAAVRARGWLRLAWACGALLALACLISSGSRGGLLGLAAGAAVAVVLVARHQAWSRRRLTIVLAAALLASSAAVLALPRARASLLDAVRQGSANSGDEQRLGMLEVGLRMGADRWWLGQGPGLTPRTYPLYRDKVDLGLESAFQLHSTPLQIWADTGLPGLLAAAALVFLVLHATWKAAAPPAAGQESPTTPPAWAARTAGITLAAYAALALTDYQLDVAPIAAALAASLGLLAAFAHGTPGSPDAAPRGIRLVPAAAGAVTLGVLLGTGLREGPARSVFSGAMDVLEAEADMAGFDAGVQRAVALLPDNPHFAAGGAAAHLRFSYASPQREQQAAHEAAAIVLLQQALRAEPDFEFAHFNLGWLLLTRAPAEAARHFRAAQRLVPDRSGVYLGLALARLGEGAEARVVEPLALELLNDPRFATAPAWDVPALSTRRAAALEHATTLALALGAQAKPEYHERFARTARLLGWLSGAGAPDPVLPGVAAPATPGQLRVRPETPGRQVLEVASRFPAERRDLLARFLFARTRKTAAPEVLAVLEQLLDSCGNDWRCWLTAEAGRNPPLVRTLRRERQAYTVLAYNMDLPVPMDAYVVQESLLAEWFFEDVFPARGHLPESVLASYVAARDL